jgi:protein involved in polysaccharide export with SLBB domain
LSTPLNALYSAGGPTSRGSLRILRQYRGKQLVREIDLYDFLLHGVRAEVDRLMPGDTILVPPVGPQVSVAGMVRRPAIYELKGEKSLSEVLDLAGGLLVAASLKQINVERVEAHQRRTMLSLQLPEGSQGASQEMAAYRVQDGDSVLVSAILPYNEQAVYLDGHVFRPGKYAYRDGMTINDLLPSYQAVMPEPADHAEIIRLQAPDYRPETISLNLADVLTGNEPIKLQPFDVVRVFSRYQNDAPMVAIRGEVMRPGAYPLSKGMTLAGLVQMAGGLKRSAYREEADLSSYVVQDDEKVIVRDSVVELGKALAGEKSSDVALQPGDVVGIRQLTGWQDIGASVTLEGEVLYAGTYGIKQGERLSSVLKRAGGFRVGAFPAGAVLERAQVRELAERNRQEMIRRVEASTPNVKAGVLNPQEQQSLVQSMQMQQQQVLMSLRNHPASGRQVIRISSDIRQWANTSADIELRAGDRLVIPKQPNFVLVSGQVYNATAISYVPGKDAKWYLNQAGGVTQSGNKKAVYIVRADGSVVGHGGGWFNGEVMNIRLKPGDAVIIPEKVTGGSQAWRNVIGIGQIMSAMAIAGAAAGVF